MKSRKYFIVPLLIAAVSSNCLADEKTVLSREEQTKALVEGNNTFALELYAKLRGSEGNLFLSPYSISTALAMTYGGAERRTAAQMAKVLRFPRIPYKLLHVVEKDRSTYYIEPELIRKTDLAPAFARLQNSLTAEPEKKGYELSIANALWPQKGFDFKAEFINLVRMGYGAGLSEVDFVAATESARKTINAWVEKKTKAKIKELIKKGMINNMTRLVLTNAIYFKGDWAEQFDESATRPAPFTLAGGEKIDVPMMNQTEKFGYAEADNLQVIDMPYAGDDLSMTIFLPGKDRTLSDFEEKLTFKSLLPSLKGLRKREVNVSMPKFKVTSEFSMADILKSMGMTDAFAPGAADFSGMNGRKDLYISAVVHKAFVEVNEEGTEAAAATVVGMALLSVREKPPVFRADRPFLFLIRQNKTGSILFIGRVVNPKA